ncbi:MAG: hypothetical protein OMOMHJEC_03351 [Xanthomonadales bacterium]|nr:hypothetical protein [Xanthomonadales bacterium]
MADYNFRELNDKDFESLAVDLLSQRLGVTIERFKPGRDLGVDGRYFSPGQGEVVVQCKHWLKSGLPALVTKLRSTERDKIAKLKPASYLLVTSLELSRVNKAEIKTALHPFIKTESDVFGAEDLNDMLALYPDLERKHYKLWISSSNVLRSMLNNAILGRSNYKLQEIIRDSHRYVRTEAHAEALVRLEKMRSIIITGAPGVGKTLLADQLARDYVARGFELCVIENSIEEAEAIYQERKQQLFYFDDFLGSTKR